MELKLSDSQFDCGLDQENKTDLINSEYGSLFFVSQSTVGVTSQNNEFQNCTKVLRGSIFNI